MTNPGWLKAAAVRSGQEAWTLGHVFERYRKLEGRSSEELAADVGCSPRVLLWLSLCRRPAGEDFAAQVRALSERFGVEAHRLAAVLRRVEVRDALAARPVEDAAHDGQALQLAARDRRDDGSEP